MQGISWLSKQLCRQESAYTKVKEQKTKEKLCCSVTKLITLLKFPQQVVLRSGSQILEETDSQGRRKEALSKGHRVHGNPSHANSCACGYFTLNKLLWSGDVGSSLGWIP